MRCSRVGVVSWEAGSVVPALLGKWVVCSTAVEPCSGDGVEGG